MFLTVVVKSISLSLVIAFTILTGMSQDTHAWCWLLKKITSLYKKTAIITLFCCFYSSSQRVTESWLTTNNFRIA